jgi:hypothetical protein
MTNQQFAIAAGGTTKWVQNAAMILGRRFRRTPEEARWLGLVGSLNQGLGMPLRAAAALANEVFGKPAQTSGDARRSKQRDIARIVVDRGLYSSIATARLSRALVREVPKSRGRRRRRENPLTAAERYGLDIDLLRISLKRSPAERLAELDQNAAFINAMRSGKRPIQRRRVTT